MKTIANPQLFRILFEKWSCAHPHIPTLNPIIKSSLPEQFYRSSLEEGVCKLEGGSASALLQGLGFLDVAVSSGHIGDYLGEREAKFPCRWIQPSGNFTEETLCERLLQMGYNGVILDSLPKNPMMFHELGIQVILKPQVPEVTPLDPEWNSDLGDLKHVHAVYWQGSYTASNYFHHPEARDDLQIDLALREVRALEKMIDNQCALVYELAPSGSVHWIPEFMDEVGAQTMISFSALAGKPTDDHQGYYPLWELLRELPDTSATRLLPILNMGGVEQGEGLWPVIPLELMEFVINHMQRQPFAGAIVLTRYLSKPGTFLDGSLWTAGHSLWGGCSPSLLLESWCTAYHPALANLELITDFWRVGRRLSSLRDVGKCTTEECRLISEGLIAELNRLQGMVDRCEECQSPTVRDYFTYFARDSRRKILHFLQLHHAPMVNVLNGDDLLESFWTVIQQSGGSGLTTGAKVTLLDRPQKGEEGSPMRLIYNEVIS